MAVDANTANQIYRYLITHGYLDDDEHLLSKYHDDKDNDNLPAFPSQLQPFAHSIHKLISNVVNPNAIDAMFGNANKPKNTINQDNLNRKEFQALWRQINQKSIYQIQLDSDKLIKDSITAINQTSHERNNHFVLPLTYVIKTAKQQDHIDQNTLKQGEGFKKVQTDHEQYSTHVQTPIKYDLIGQVADQTNLTRRTVAAILTQIEPSVFAQFNHHPEGFIAEVSRLICEQSAKLIVQNISYELTQERYDSHEIFVSNVSLSDNATFATRHVWQYVETDSQIEREFVAELEQAVNDVVVYAKLPKNFTIPTPFGGYNPDWANCF